MSPKLFVQIAPGHWLCLRREPEQFIHMGYVSCRWWKLWNQIWWNSKVFAVCEHYAWWSIYSAWFSLFKELIHVIIFPLVGNRFNKSCGAFTTALDTAQQVVHVYCFTCIIFVFFSLLVPVSQWISLSWEKHTGSLQTFWQILHCPPTCVLHWEQWATCLIRS